MLKDSDLAKRALCGGGGACSQGKIHSYKILENQLEYNPMGGDECIFGSPIMMKN